MSGPKVHLYDAVKLGRVVFDFTKCGKQVTKRTVTTMDESRVTCAKCHPHRSRA
jgi:hypothetical protein